MTAAPMPHTLRRISAGIDQVGLLSHGIGAGWTTPSAALTMPPFVLNSISHRIADATVGTTVGSQDVSERRLAGGMLGSNKPLLGLDARAERMALADPVDDGGMPLALRRFKRSLPVIADLHKQARTIVAGVFKEEFHS